MAIRPLYDRVLTRRLESEEKTRGGIIIPVTAKEKPLQGEVISVGQGKMKKDGSLRELAVKKGDQILFDKYSGTEIKVDGEKLVILREDDILAIVK